MEQALARALAKDPAERFASITEFTTALQRQATLGVDAYTGTERSIAVLPFVNASPDPENEYLSDGITDELIDALAKISGLRVASRTSVFALKGKPQDVRAIGALLGASVVLEGTVRKAGERLRITAQLTSTEDGRLVWSDRYDRTLRDVFEIQDELARTIVDTLRITSFADLAPPKRKRYTQNIEAYGLYLKGRFAWNKRTQEGVVEGIRFFEQAIDADPQYALSYTGLADCYALHVDYSSVHVVKGSSAREHTRAAPSSWTTRSRKRTRRWPGRCSSMTGIGTARRGSSAVRSSSTRVTPRRISGMRFFSRRRGRSRRRSSKGTPRRSCGESGTSGD